MKKIYKKIVLSIITFLAKKIIQKHKPYIIGVVGSVGKTSTKDSMASVLPKDKTIYTKKSNNSDFGVPLTIIDVESGYNNLYKWILVITKGLKVLHAKEYAKYLVLEIGADKKGDIKQIVKWVHCDVVVVTVFGDVPVHIENFKNKEELIEEDFQAIKKMKKEGVIIFNSECQSSIHKIKEIMLEENNINKNIIPFGFKNGDYKVGKIKSDINKKITTASIIKNQNTKDEINMICSNVIGSATIMSAVPALIISDILNIDRSESLENIKNMKRENGRMKVLAGKNESVIIDDTYNSSPIAVLNGISAVKEIKNVNRKIAVLGDMMELGKHTKEEHFKIGQAVADVFDVLITVGSRSKFTADGAIDAGMGEGWVLACHDTDDVATELVKILKKDDIVYVKGSQSMRMENIVSQICDGSVDTKKELVRQNKEWLKE
jgi:UDP-N-acetylmuramoyl-tripeptide--D-alanyl-D-alanine ligase